jgi:PAS domain S-box-containing protein
LLNAKGTCAPSLLDLPVPKMIASTLCLGLREGGKVSGMLGVLKWILIILGCGWVTAVSAQSVQVEQVAIQPAVYNFRDMPRKIPRTFVAKLSPVVDAQLQQKFGARAIPLVPMTANYLPQGNVEGVVAAKARAQEVGRFRYEFEPIPADLRVLGASYAISNLDIEHGLKSNEVTSLHFTQGEVWIGYGSGGVSCLRGGRIMHLDERAGFDNSEVTAIQAYGGAIWVGTFGGGLYCVRNGMVERHGIDHGFPTDHVLSMTVFGNALWIGSYGSGLVKYDGAGFIHYDKSEYIASQIPYLAADSAFLYMGSDAGKVLRTDRSMQVALLQVGEASISQGDLSGLTVADGTLHLLYGDGGHLEVHGADAHYAQPPAGDAYHAICASRRGSVWMGSASGSIWHVDHGQLTGITQAEGLARSGVQVIGEDHAGNVWLGSARHGVFVILNSSFQILLDEENSLFTQIKAITAHPRGVLVPTAGAMSLLQGDKSMLHWRHPLLQDLNGIAVTEGKIWATSFRGIMELAHDSLFHYHCDDLTEASFNTNLGLQAMQDGQRLLISNYNYGFFTWDPQTQMLRVADSAQAYSLCKQSYEDKAGRIWIGSLKGGVSFVQGSRRTVLSTAYGEVNAFAEDSWGNVWIGTKFGLLQYTIAGKLLYHELGGRSAQNEIRSLLYVPDKAILWIGTAAGLGSYDLRQGSLQIFTQAQGIGGSYFGGHAAALSGQSAYWANNKGLLQHDGVGEATTSALGLHLAGIDLDRVGSKTDWERAQAQRGVRYAAILDGVPEQLSLANDVTAIAFYFSAGCWYGAAMHTLYYQVDADGPWLPSSDNHTVLLTDLKPCAYNIHFKIVGPDGQASPVLQYAFEIRKPYYLSLWFILLVTIGGGAMAYLLLRRALRIKFENIRSYSDRDAYLKRIRLMSTLLVFALPASYLAEAQLGILGYHREMLVWLGLIFLSGIMLWASTYVRQFSLVRLRQMVLVSAISMIFFISVHTQMSDYAPTFVIGFIVMFSFASIIFDSLRAFTTFALFTFAMLCYLFIDIDTNNQNHLLFLSNFPFAFIFGGVYHFLQLYRISNMLFAEKVLSVYDKYVLVCNRSGQVVYANEFVTKELGVADEQVLGEGWWQLDGMQQDSSAHLAALVQARIAGDTEAEVFSRRLSMAGFAEPRTIAWEYQVIESGYLMGIGTDVTEREEQEVRIKTLSLIASTTENFVIITDLHRKIEYVNQSFLDGTGYQLEEVIGQNPGKLLQGPETDPETVKAISATLAAGQTFRGEILNYTKAGKPYWVMIVLQPILDEKGKAFKFASLGIDITAQKVQEIEMRKAFAASEQKYKLIADNTSDGIAILEPDGRFSFVSPSFLSILGYPASAYLTTDHAVIAESIHPDDRKIPLQAHASALAHRREHASYTYRIRDVHGAYLWQEDSATFVYDADGRHEKTYLIARDVTQRITHEKELERLLHELTLSYEELRQFSFIAQHNLRAPVTNILGLIDLIDDEKIDHPMLPKFVAAMRVTAERFDETIRDLNHVLSIKSRSDLSLQAVDIATCFARVCEAHAQQIQQYNASIETDFAAGQPIFTTEAYLHSVFEIMLTNALSFVEAERQPQITVRSRLDGGIVELIFSDNGIGMDAEIHKDRLFGLYQRFHAGIQGKGLGLFLLKSMVEASGGTVTAASAPGQGFVLHIRWRAA